MREIIVYADWVGLPETSKMGTLRSELSRGEEIFSFTYSDGWLNSGYAQEIDPDLKLYGGPQYISDEKPNFGLFLDSSPDRWGRMLMERREAIVSRKTGQSKKSLRESDFLLGVSDETRMGALRFKMEEEGDFLANHEEVKVPPLSSIRELEHASLRIEENDFFKNEEAQKWLMMLMAPGSSLGGARPKANVINPEGHLWIAKFPSKHDEKNIGAWEFLVNQMAKDLGIDVAIGKAKTYSQKRHTYLTKRFDRTSDNKRIHFASAMSLLGFKDGYSHKEGGSYLELVELLEHYGCEAHDDIRELWRRIVFSVAISNTDDHLRNHGFLLSKNGWRLSPAYDINPIEKGTGLSLNISEVDNSLDFDLCMEVIDYFRWEEKEAQHFIDQTKNMVSQWKQRATQMGIPNSEQTMMETAFER